MSKKWSKRWPDIDQPWPVEGPLYLIYSLSGKRTSIEKKPPEEPSTRQKTQEDQTYKRQAHEERDEEKMNDGCTVCFWEFEDTRKDESEDDEQPKKEDKMRTAAKMVNMITLQEFQGMKVH
ncbi:Hypothetical predicted protein [Xyrichtys novacula]|uniref:Uncharacterized protein n=1 Tax=Xyrichtys novacula TaxID=13765 RepID=A0AAV1F996_XYRNO|nr:Hypothetical predicted protein [Xyrichtys novacula]